MMAAVPKSVKGLDIMEIVNRRFKEFREILKLSEEEFAEKTGIKLKSSPVPCSTARKKRSFGTGCRSCLKGSWRRLWRHWKNRKRAAAERLKCTIYPADICYIYGGK